MAEGMAVLMKNDSLRERLIPDRQEAGSRRILSEAFRKLIHFA
jgi:hypothetical protein